MTRRFSSAAVAAMAAAGALVLAQDSQQPTFRLEANYIRVDVYAVRGDEAVEDLAPEDVELFEDGVLQTITAFEHVKVRPSVAPELRRDPSSPSASRALAEDPRVRVLVMFLDNLHVQIDGSHGVRDALVATLDNAVGDDDLIGVMHPMMSARDITLGRKTTAIAGFLRNEWAWGRSGRDTPLTPQEEQWFQCYGPGRRFSEMQARAREKMALDALSDLVTHLGGLREERKAVLLVTEGWRLFGDDRELAALEPGEAPPPGPGIFVGGTGRIQSKDPRTPMGASRSDCDMARIELAHMDNTRRLRDLMGEANRANVSFYPVYPRGLQAGDRPLVLHTSSADTRESMQRLSAALEQLRELAINTDGLAVVNTNDLEGGMRRVVSDLTSYYLLGYYTTNTTPDGRFREITVRVRRPGIRVRARRGYRAMTREEAARVRASSSARSAAGEEPARPANTRLRREDDRVNPADLTSLRHAVLWKRSPSTGREYVATQDPRMRRTDRLRVEHATDVSGTPSARMLGGQGHPMAVPVQVSDRPDASGTYRWIVADVALAPLAPGDYSIELSVGGVSVVTPFRVVP